MPTLIESELFGYVKGAFTGAVQSKDGLLAIADGGTVFWTKSANCRSTCRRSCLRALQEKEIRPVGGTKSIPINVRILAATNKDLEQAVAHGEFRRDLYFRLNVLTSAFRRFANASRTFLLLTGHFLERLARSTGVQRNISDEALKLMLAYEWPGNVRELENCLERATALSSGGTLHLSDLPTRVQDFKGHLIAAPAAADPLKGITPIADLEKHAILSAIEQLHGDKLEAATTAGHRQDHSLPQT